MWISKKKWQAMEKRVADLEGQVQGQLKEGVTILPNQQPLGKLYEALPHQQTANHIQLKLPMSFESLILLLRK
ncbi:hypothetical protein D4759_07390 [Clostridiales bacterium AHG0011]|nr:hypothetical protein [Clostridiales bacterium AHG0011]